MVGEDFMNTLIKLVIGLVLCMSAQAQIQPFPNPGDWFVPVARDDTTFYNTLLYNAQGEWPITLVNLEITHPTPFLVVPEVQGVLKAYLEVTCGGATNSPDGTPAFRYRYTFPLPSTLQYGGYRHLVFKRCVGSTGAYTAVGRTDIFVGIVRPYTPRGPGQLAIFPEHPEANRPFVVSIWNLEYEQLIVFRQDGDRLRFFLEGSLDDGFLPNAERPIRRTVTLSAGNYTLNNSRPEILGTGIFDALILPFQVSGGVAARPLPTTSISSQFLLGLLLVFVGARSLRRMRFG
jgi:hypothetical protein